MYSKSAKEILLHSHIIPIFPSFLARATTSVHASGVWIFSLAIDIALGWKPFFPLPLLDDVDVLLL